MLRFLKNTVEKIAISDFRNASGSSWEKAMEEIESLIKILGVKPEISVWKDKKGREYKNFTISYCGKVDKKILIGAHYDTFEKSPGADDNASSIAVMLGLIKTINNCYSGYYSLDIVFYACEEPPFFGTPQMGSYKDALNRTKNEIKVMICLEMVGYYSDKANSQDYPLKFLKYVYGDKGNFLIGVTNLKSSLLGIKIISKLNKYRSKFYRKLIIPFNFSGMDWSDHRNYWSRNIPAIMLTDTAMFRNSNYHTEKDIPSSLDYNRMSNLVSDLFNLLNDFD